MRNYVKLVKSSFFIKKEDISKTCVLLSNEGYSINLDDDGNIVEINISRYLKTNLNNHINLFKQLAPVVRSGSFLENKDDVGTRWRWVFDEGMCHTVNLQPCYIWMDSSKSTGILRPIDDLGRIVIPKAVRDELGIKEDDWFEVLVGSDMIHLKKSSERKDDKS